MQSNVIFISALILLLTSLQVVAQNLLHASDNMNLSDPLSHVTSQYQTLEAKWKSQQDELKLLREQLEIKKNLTREIDKLKLQLQETQSYKDAVLNGPTEIKSILNSLNFATKSETELLISSSEVKITDKFTQVFTSLGQMSADIQAMRKTVNEESTCQTSNKDMLTKIMSKLEQHDVEQNSHRNQSCELHIDLNTKTFNSSLYYFSYNESMMTWYEADDFCRSHGMHLVSVETKEEWHLLKPEVEKLSSNIGGAPWSSGSDAAEEGKWKWTATGSDVIFYAGRDFMENVASENCMYLYIDHWGDYNCTGKLPFICEDNNQC